MRPASTVVDSPLFDGHLQMTLVERDQEVQALAAQASADPFTYRVGSGRTNGSSKNSPSQVRHLFVELFGKDAVRLVDHEPMRMVARKGLPELLQDPFRTRMCGHVVMENPSGSQFHQHEYVQSSERGRDHDEEVTRHDELGVIADEGRPSLFWIGRAHRAAVAQALPNRAGRNPDSEFQSQLVGDPFLAPGRILGSHLSDQIPKILGQARSSRRFGLPMPEQPASFVVPTDERIRFDIHQRTSPRK